MTSPGPIDPVQRQLASRRLIATLRRHLRREPLTPDVRVDVLVRELRATSEARPPTHRGATPLTLDDAQLRAVVDELVADGTFGRRGHRVSLSDAAPSLDPMMRGRIDRLLAGLAEAGAAPPPVSGIAARLGIPPGVVDGLRRLKASGRQLLLVTGRELPELLAIFPEITLFERVMAENGALVSIAAGIDFPRATWDRLQERLAAMAARGPLSVSRVRRELHATRRHAEAILRRHRDERRRTRGSARSG